MTEQTIDVTGLPEGWKAVAHRKPLKEEYILYGDEICKPKGLMNRPWLIVEKIQPRRIVLEETYEDNSRYTSGLHETQFLANGDVRLHNLKKKWREVKEPDIHKDEPKLNLTKKDMLELIEHIKLGGQLNPKIAEFIDYEQPEPYLRLSVDECKSIVYAPIDLHVKLEKFIKENS